MPDTKLAPSRFIQPRPCEHCNSQFKPRHRAGRFCSRKCSQDWESLRKPNQSEKFWSYIDIKEENDCWLWGGYCNPDGYGMLRLNGKIQRCHRFAYEDMVGPIPLGMEILHGCDTPSCCNPNHLKPGTHLENMEDMARKKRSGAYKYEGEKHYRATLKDTDVIKIRKEYAENKEIYSEIAKRYGVTKSAIGILLQNKSFKHLLKEEVNE